MAAVFLDQSKLTVTQGLWQPFASFLEKDKKLFYFCYDDVFLDWLYDFVLNSDKIIIVTLTFM